MTMHAELWFPSVIWSSVVHSIDNNALKRYAYERQKADKGRQVSNYLGWQSSDILQGECKDIDLMVDTLNKEIEECRRQVGLPALQIQNLWININPKGAYNQLHNHQGSVFSGVYYVDAKEDCGNIQFDRGDNADYHLPMVPETQTYFSVTRATYKAKTSALYVFPSWLKHSVQANQGVADRISISFNYGEKL